MNSFQETRRQLRLAAIAIAIIIPIGVIGFMIFEYEQNWTVLDALWTTVITISTVGYGDIHALSPAGRVFTIFLIVFGLGAFAFAAQAAFSFFASPEIRALRQIRRSEKKIGTLRNHFIICGEGELVDKTIGFVLSRVDLRLQEQLYAQKKRISNSLGRFFGHKERGIGAFFRNIILNIRLLLSSRHLTRRSKSILDAIVVVTNDSDYAKILRQRELLVIEDDPTNARALQSAGIRHAQAMMVMLSNDTETLLTVLTADADGHHTSEEYRHDTYITAATLNENMTKKMLKVGADNVIAPFEVAGQFLNNATLRPTVNDFFNNILFGHHINAIIVQLHIYEDSPWLGKRLRQINLRERFEAGIIGIRLNDGTYLYAPNEDHIITQHETILAIVPSHYVNRIREDCRHEQTTDPIINHWRRAQLEPVEAVSPHSYSVREAHDAIQEMSEHYIICGDDRTAQNAISKLDPERPFVVISHNNTMSTDLLKKGFRVIHGDPTQDETLQDARVDRALAMMVSIEDNADSILTIVNARNLSERLLITATASNDEMIPKLRQAGADRVVSPFNIAARFVLLATTRPAVSDFMNYVLFNPQSGLETTELYMQDNSPWIGKTIGELLLERIFRAGVIGIRQANGKYIYAPPESYAIGEHEVLIITTPMVNSDELRLIAHGTDSKRPDTLRRKSMLTTTNWVN